MNGEIERRVLGKITWRIIPFVMLLYLVSFLDRVNVGFAALTMNKDLGFSASVYGFGAGIFFFGYFLFEVPSNIILHKLGARIWIARIMITWGIVSAANAFVEGPYSFYIARFLLGLAEAGFFPGIILYLGYWFPARRRAAAIAVFMAAAPLATVIGSPLSGALLEMGDAFGLAGWQWMFLIEAVPSVVLGIVVLFFLTDRPEQARWLSEEERCWLVAVMNAESADKAATAHHSAWRGLAEWRVLVLSLVYFGTSAGLYAIGLWAPQIIAQFPLTPLQIGALNAIPGAIAVVAMVIWSWNSDRTGERAWHTAGACFLAALGLVYAGSAVTLIGVLIALSLVNIGTNGCKGPFWSIPTLFLSGSAAATGIATINAIGNLGGFIGPAMIGWLKDLTGSFLGGLYFVAATLFISAALTIVLARSQHQTSSSCANMP